MARLARLVVSAVPHHVTQRGNRRQTVFFGDDDYRAYLTLLAEHTRTAGVAVWAWCLMPNHVHLMLTPPSAGAFQVMVAVRSPVVITKLPESGGDARPIGTLGGEEGVEGALESGGCALLVATTVNVYAVPLTRLLTTTGLLKPVAVTLGASGDDAVTV